jgi:hypothetical protein
MKNRSDVQTAVRFVRAYLVAAASGPRMKPGILHEKLTGG